jgi:hypothetical protein
MQTDRWVPPLASKESRPAAARTRPGGARGGAACREVRSRRNTARAHRGGRTPTTPSARVATFRVRDPSRGSSALWRVGRDVCKASVDFFEIRGLHAAARVDIVATAARFRRGAVELTRNCHVTRRSSSSAVRVASCRAWARPRPFPVPARKSLAGPRWAPVPPWSRCSALST